MDLSNFSIPKRSKRDTVLDKHNYTLKVLMEDGKNTYFIIPSYDNMYDAIANINEGVSGIGHYSGAIVKNNEETWKEFFIRLGWVDKEGNIL